MKEALDRQELIEMSFGKNQSSFIYLITKYDYIVTKGNNIMVHKDFSYLWNMTSSSSNSNRQDLVTYVWNEHTKSFDLFHTQFDNYYVLVSYLLKKCGLTEFILLDKKDLLIELNKHEGMKAAWIVGELENDNERK